jgi:hypothetical protein
MAVIFRYHPIEGLQLVLYDVVVEDKRSVCLQLDSLQSEPKALTGDHLGIILKDLCDVVIVIAVAFYIAQGLLKVSAVGVKE